MVQRLRKITPKYVWEMYSVMNDQVSTHKAFSNGACFFRVKSVSWLTIGIMIFE